MVVQWLASRFTKHNKSVPNKLKRTGQLAYNLLGYTTICYTRDSFKKLTDTGTAAKAFSADRRAVQAWRDELEGKGTNSVAAAPALPVAPTLGQTIVRFLSGSPTPGAATPATTAPPAAPARSAGSSGSASKKRKLKHV